MFYVTGNAEMSPASRYIAMNRQGMITTSQDTPKRSEEVVKAIPQSSKSDYFLIYYDLFPICQRSICFHNFITDDTMSTPPMDNALSTPNIALFSTESKRRIIAIKKGEMPSEPLRTPKNPCM